MKSFLLSEAVLSLVLGVFCTAIALSLSEWQELPRVVAAPGQSDSSAATSIRSDLD
jgi:hypothetical protein